MALPSLAQLRLGLSGSLACALAFAAGAASGDDPRCGKPRVVCATVEAESTGNELGIDVSNRDPLPAKNVRVELAGAARLAQGIRVQPAAVAELGPRQGSAFTLRFDVAPLVSGSATEELTLAVLSDGVPYPRAEILVILTVEAPAGATAAPTAASPAAPSGTSASAAAGDPSARASAEALCDALSPRAAAAERSCGALADAVRRSTAIDGDLTALADCPALLGSPIAATAERAEALADSVVARVAEADQASTAACDWLDPADLAAAEANFRRVTQAAGRTRAASQAARAALADLEALAARSAGELAAAAARRDRLRTVRERVRAALPDFVAGRAQADACRAAGAAFADAAARLTAALDLLPEEQQSAGLRRCAARRAGTAARVGAIADPAILRDRLAEIERREQAARAAIAACAGLERFDPESVQGRIDAALARARAAGDRLGGFETAITACVANAAAWVDRMRRQPPAAATPAGTWTAVGGVQTVAGGVAPGVAAAVNPRPPEIDAWIAAAIDAYNNCRASEALAWARKIQSVAPDHPWLAANLGLIAKRERAQAASIAALARAQSAAGAGDYRGAIDAAHAAARDAPSCMSQTISDVLGQTRDRMTAAQAAQREEAARIFVQVLGGLVDAYNRGVAAAGGGPAGAGAAGGPARQVACNSTAESGADQPETVAVAVGGATGTATFHYEMFNVKDRMLVEYGGVQLLDTGCVSGSRSVPLTLSGWGGQVVVRVQPNCAGTTGTNWNFRLDCPR